MDTLSHGLWGGITVGRKTKKSFWLAFFFGIAPDIFSFGLLFAQVIFTALFFDGSWAHFGPGDGHPSVPQYVHSLYDLTHSAIVFLPVFFLVWWLGGKPVWEMWGWGFHIALDIFTHSERFFPTPFLWPLSSYTFDGMSWAQPLIFIPNVALLLTFYGLWWWHKRKNRATATSAVE